MELPNESSIHLIDLCVRARLHNVRSCCRTRLALGPQRVPSYRGSDMLATRPLIDVSRADAGRPRGGIYSCAKYDQLLGEPADSPVVAVFGSRGQFAGEIALPYSLGRGIE